MPRTGRNPNLRLASFRRGIRARPPNGRARWHGTGVCRNRPLHLDRHPLLRDVS
jgi:hypothetical protein